MSSNFRIYRILCSTPPALESERLLCEAAISKFGEEVTFPHQVLLACASFRGGFDADRHRAGGESNVRMCDFFVHLFGEDWPGVGFRSFIELAQTCMADPAMPMRDVVVLFQNFSEADEKLRKYREKLEAGGNCVIRDFGTSAELEAQLREVLGSWWASVQAKP